MFIDGYCVLGVDREYDLTAEALLLISDAVALAHMPPGVYDSPVGGQVDLDPNGRLNLLGTGYLAGWPA